MLLIVINMIGFYDQNTGKTVYIIFLNFPTIAPSL